jgi:catechol-2,3-dioxygenase
LEPREETFSAFDDSRAAYVADPDGNVVEIWTWDVRRHRALE